MQANQEMNIFREDLENIYNSLSEVQKKKLENSVILITGCAGFLGFYFCNFFVKYAKQLKIKHIVGTDIFLFGTPQWLQKLADENEHFDLRAHDITKDDVKQLFEDGVNPTHVIHMASVASPTFYRKYPITTIEANIWGLRNLFENYKESRDLKGFLFFSSSEIYGDPDKDNIPTSEEYLGNVSCIGPRACYDESKRFGETLCYTYSNEYKMPITIARPFNNFGPGMSLNDKRVPADFAKAIVENKDIEIFSDGKPTRTFCYISDAISGYIKVLLHDKFDYFNIGIEKPEISIFELAKIYQEKGKKIFGYTGEIKLSPPPEKNYLAHNPNRRSPIIEKARSVIGYSPSIIVENGVERFLKFLYQEKNN